MVTQSTLRTYDGKQVLMEIFFKLTTALDLKKSPKQIKLPISLFTWAPISELPSKMSTMDVSLNPKVFFITNLVNCHLFTGAG